MFILRLLTRRAMRSAMRQIVEGRYLDPAGPERGRFSRQEVTRLLHETERNITALLPAANLDRYPRLGNRQNAYFSVVMLAAYRAFVAAGVAPDYAIELIADAGWKIYLAMLKPPRAVARLLVRDPQRRMNFMLRAWLAYPFAAPRVPEQPGYHVQAWAEPERFCTHWTACPPLETVQALGTPQELELFRRTWCLYDFAVAREMVPGGRFSRPHCLSRGDDVCDMAWFVVDEPAV